MIRNTTARNNVAKPGRRVTAADVAREAGVQPACVSVVLNGARSNARISAEARERILAAAERLQYRPSAPAQALATGRTMQIAVLAESTEFQRGIQGRYPNLRGLLDSAERHNYRVVVLPIHAGRAGERQLEHLLLDKVCDGICLLADHLDSAHLTVLERCAMPCVVIGGNGPREFESQSIAGAVRVDVDNFRFGAESVEWLRRQGHRKIGYLQTYSEHEDCPHIHLVREGYRNAMTLAGLEPQFIPPNVSHATLIDRVRRGELSALVTRWMQGSLPLLISLLVAGIDLPTELTVLVLGEETDFTTLVSTGHGHQLAYHLYLQRELGQVAGNLLIRWITQDAPDCTTVLVPPGPLGWKNDILKSLTAPG